MTSSPMFSVTNAPDPKKVLSLDNTLPEYKYNPTTAAMQEHVPEPYWKSGKAKPPTEIIQTAMNSWFVENSDGTGDGYTVKRIYYKPQDKFRWTCTCTDFLVRRQGTEHPWCKHIYNVYEHFKNMGPEHQWILYPFPHQAAQYILQVCRHNKELMEVFWEDIPDIRYALVEANHGKLPLDESNIMEFMTRTRPAKNSLAAQVFDLEKLEWLSKKTYFEMP